MSQLNAIKATGFVKNRLLDFCRADHYVTDSQVDRICHHIWSGEPTQGGLAGDLWVEAAFPPRSSGTTMKSHVEQGLITPALAGLLDENQAFGMDWELREIQSESVKAARARDNDADKPAIVVSAGTGAGKTESFLFPMLDELMRNPRNPHQGTSAIILYPMNALVTDQVERLTKWLGGQTGLRIFHFTGETPENHKAANTAGYPQVDACCFRTRQQARGLEDAKGRLLSETERGDQPDVIVTNYSMLEYMLCRPQDAVFFGKNLRHIVLDEAHLYTGNLAAEITMLLRRLAIKCGTAPSAITHYATSATLVEGAESEQREALSKFAAKVFSKDEDAVTVVLGRKAAATVEEPGDSAMQDSPPSLPEWPDFPGINEVDGRDELVTSSENDWNAWMEALRALYPKMDLESEGTREISRFLCRKMPGQPGFQRLYHLLYKNKLLPLEELSKQVWGDSGEQAQEATRRMLQAGAIAREDAGATPLLPNRIHWSIRAPNGLFFSFAHELAPSPEQVYQVDGVPVGYFYSPGFFSRPEEDKTQPLLVLRDGSIGQWLLAGIEKGVRLEVAEEALPKTMDRLAALLDQLSIFKLGGTAGTALEFDPLTGELGSHGGVHLRKLDFSEQDKKALKPMGSDSRLQLVIIAEAALTQMPPFPGDSKDWKPAEGRRLLVFSDSRSEAATLGPTLTNNHERQLFRALVAETLAESSDQDTGEIDKKIQDLEASFESLPEAVKGVVEASIDKLREERDKASRGQLPKDFVEALGGGAILKEFFDRKAGERHHANNWSQKMFKLNEEAIRKTLSYRLSQELARRTLWPDLNLESAGILELAYPDIENIDLPPSYLGTLPSSELRQNLEAHLPSFLGMLLDHIRDVGAVTLGSDVTDAEYGIGGGYIGKWVSLECRFKNSLIPLITSTDDSMLATFTRAFLTEAGMSQEDSQQHWKDFLEALFRQLYENSSLKRIDWLEFDKIQSGENQSELALRIQFHKLRVRRPLQIFQCEESGQVWPRSALGLHLRSKKPSLHQVTEAELEANPRIARVRYEWGQSEVFRSGLWAEEHSAQIGPAENRRLQDLFKSGIRNVLSSTTTLELGIDIGGLNGVMMGNIPPGKASYLQRAGRAGRRADGSSLVLSYSRNSPYERKVFENFAHYLESPLREPAVFLDRKDIIRRHIHSLLFASFFSQAYREGSTKGAMAAFGGMGAFTNVPLSGYWQKGDHKPIPQSSNAQAELAETFPWGDTTTSIADAFDRFLKSNSESLTENLKRAIEALTHGTGLEPAADQKPESLISELQFLLSKRIAAWQADYTKLLNQWTNIPSDADIAHRNHANALHYQLKQLFAMTLIECFSDSMILPRYGFPIGLSELKVNAGKPSRKSDSAVASPEAYRLNRSASQAVREYAPGSKLLVGAKVVHSQGILKSWTGDDIPTEGMGLRAWFHWNEKTGEFTYDYAKPASANSDGELKETTNQGALLFIKHGFTTAASQQPTYGGKRARVGTILNICRPPDDAEMTSTFTNFFGVHNVAAHLHIGGELLAMNSGDYEQGFAVCTKCGYASSEVKSNKNGENTGRVGLPKGFDWHTSIHESNSKYSCWKQTETFVLRHLNLAARQVCDYLEIRLPKVPGSTEERRRIANTLCQALRMSGAKILNIDSRELSILNPTSGANTKISICDSLAGGAGHVRDLCAMADQWWTAAVAMIREGTTTQATLGLLTADAPVKDGLPYFSIESTINYLEILDGNAPPRTDPEEEEFDHSSVAKHLKNPRS